MQMVQIVTTKIFGRDTHVLFGYVFGMNLSHCTKNPSITRSMTQQHKYLNAEIMIRGARLANGLIDLCWPKMMQIFALVVVRCRWYHNQIGSSYTAHRMHDFFSYIFFFNFSELFGKWIAMKRARKIAIFFHGNQTNKLFC